MGKQRFESLRDTSDSTLRPPATGNGDHTDAFLKNSQVAAVSGPKQRLKRLNFLIYDAHAHTRAHIRVLIYLEPESLQSLIFR